MTTAVMSPPDVKTLATDAIKDAVHASNDALKTVRRRAEALADKRHDVIHQIRRSPVKAVGIAFGAGTLVGVVAMMAMRCAGSKQESRS